MISAIRQARTAWEQLQHDGSEPGGDDPLALTGVAHIIEETERLKLDMRAQRDEWKRAYREQQMRIRLAQREMAQRYRQMGRQRHQSGWRPPGPVSGAGDPSEV